MIAMTHDLLMNWYYSVLCLQNICGVNLEYTSVHLLTQSGCATTPIKGCHFGLNVIGAENFTHIPAVSAFRCVVCSMLKKHSKHTFTMLKIIQTRAENN